MASKPTVSVIIPAYNAERFLKETLDSVFQQRFRDFETILIDDGSTDGTAEIAQSYDGVRYYYQVNQGPAAARNAGLRISRGKYLAFLDADDLWHEEMLAACVEVLDNQPSISAVHTNWMAIDSDGRVLRRKSGWRPWRGNIFNRLLTEIPLINPAIVWRRRCFEEIGGFDQSPEMNDDWLNWLRIAHRGHLFECIDKPLAYYRKHEGNLTRSQAYRVIEWRRRALDLLFEEIDVEPQLRDRAYAEVHWVKSMAALAKEDIGEATTHFRKAVALDEQLLARAETYYAIAHGGGGQTLLDITQIGRAEAYVGQFLAALEEPPAITKSEQIKIARGEACFNLAQMAYGARDLKASYARAYLFRAARENPVQFAQRDRAVWAVRFLLGRNLIGMFRKSGTSAR